MRIPFDEDRVPCEAESLFREARIANNCEFIFRRKAIEGLESLRRWPEQLSYIEDNATVGLVLGKFLEEGDFAEIEDLPQAVKLTLYFLCKAIDEGHDSDPELKRYRNRIIPYLEILDYLTDKITKENLNF